MPTFTYQARNSDEYLALLFSDPRPHCCGPNVIQAPHHKARNVKLTGKAYSNPKGNTARKLTA
jgi:hypothetical protein